MIWITDLIAVDYFISLFGMNLTQYFYGIISKGFPMQFCWGCCFINFHILHTFLQDVCKKEIWLWGVVQG